MSVLSYGAFAWMNVVQKKSVADRLTNVQSTSNLYMSGALKTTQTQTLEVSQDIVRIDLYHKELAKKSARKQIRLGLFRLRKDHRCMVVIRKQESDFIQKTEVLDQEVGTVIPPRQRAMDKRISTPTRKVQMYTDGPIINLVQTYKLD